MAHLRAIARSSLGLVLLLAVVAVAAQGATVPHTHTGRGLGIYNQDHDGALLAILHGAAMLSAAQPAMQPFVVLASIAPVSSRPIDSAPRPLADSRAPPRA